jgi:hypothetical protein
MQFIERLVESFLFALCCVGLIAGMTAVVLGLGWAMVTIGPWSIPLFMFLFFWYVGFTATK